jgi:Uncharacterised protein family (UPF0203)
LAKRYTNFRFPGLFNDFDLQWYKNRFLQGDVGGAETCHSLLLDWKECVSIAVEDHEAAERTAAVTTTSDSSAGDKKGS